MISDIRLSFSRILRTKTFPVLLAVLAAVVFFAPVLGREEGIPEAGLCDLDKSEISERIADYLTANGYIICEDERLMRQMIEKGTLNCGAVIPDGFEAMMYDDSLDGKVLFITSPLTYSPEIYQSHIAAAIFGELTPIITAEQLSRADITVSESVAEYRTLSGDGMRFTFSVETVNSEVQMQNERPRTYLLGAASMLIFSIFMYSACDILVRDMAPLTPRIGIGKVILHTVVPDICIRATGVMLAVICAALAAKWLLCDGLILSLVPALCVYTLYTASFAIFTSAILGDTARIRIFTFFILILSLIFCPIYLDISLSYPALSALRIPIQPYWLWICADYPLCAAGAPLALLLSFAALYLRFAKRPIK